MEDYEDFREDSEDKEWMYDEVTGQKRKDQMAVLNKRKISKYELDEVFTSE